MSRVFSSIVSGILGLGVLAITGIHAQAVTIGLNLTYNAGGNPFTNAGDPTIMASGDTTGVVSQSNWNTITFADWYGPQFTPVLGIDSTQEGHPTSGTLIDSTGASTSVNVKTDKGMNWFTPTNAAYAGTTDTEKMLFGYANANAGDTTFSINNLGTSNYDVYVYFANNTSVNSSVTLGATSYYFSTAIGQASSFNQILNTTSGVFTDSGNYAKFSSVAPSSGTIAFVINDATGVTGLQIVSVPEPTTAAVLGLGSIASLMIRRRKSA